MAASISKADATAATPDRSLEKTFKEVIHEEHTEGRDVNWKSFKDGFRIHQAGHAWADAVAEAANSRPRSGLATTLARTTSMRSPQKHPAWADEQDEAVAALLQQRPPVKEQPTQVSLKALLADCGGYSEYDDDEDGCEGERGGVGRQADEDDDDEEGGKEGDIVHACCVCMLRHKGAAFIPCGHTFCRLCSRDLWVTRGNCPLCNAFILEILHIF